ncbi:hypothetical protein A2U01_0013603, partial [Trifolium medium]|nr:hypothetical protein [Trifolium medium]
VYGSILTEGKNSTSEGGGEDREVAVSEPPKMGLWAVTSCHVDNDPHDTSACVASHADMAWRSSFYKLQSISSKHKSQQNQATHQTHPLLQWPLLSATKPVNKAANSKTTTTSASSSNIAQSDRR